MAGIEIRGVSKVFPGGRLALDGIDLAVADGELLVLVGPSGSGKTSLLRLVAGLDCPSSGSICRDGRDLLGVPPQRRDVAMVFQQHGLYGHLSARRNLTFGLELRSGHWLAMLARMWPGRRSPAAIEQQALEAARLVGIEGLLERRVAELSGGERQRVELGRAVARQPTVWLMDEPLASLDAPARLVMRREIKDLQRKLGITTIYVTHDQAEAMALADRIAILDRGRLQQVGVPREIYDRPKNMMVAAFFGSQGMNLLPGKLHDRRGKLHFEFESGELEVPAHWHGSLRHLMAEQLVVGIRPEALQMTPPNELDAAAGITGTVLTIEDLGDMQLIAIELNQQVRWTVRHDGPAPAIGARINVRVPFDRLHWFRGTTGDSLALESTTCQ